MSRKSGVSGVMNISALFGEERTLEVVRTYYADSAGARVALARQGDSGFFFVSQ